MIDCSQTENYFAEKARMTKKKQTWKTQTLLWRMPFKQ